MRICRYRYEGRVYSGLYFDDYVVPLSQAAQACADATDTSIHIPEVDNLMAFLPQGPSHEMALAVDTWLADIANELPADLRYEASEVEFLLPHPRPRKLFLLAGNYAKHIEERGGYAAQRDETFPYVFMKPPTTTLTDPGKPVYIPKIAPEGVDWECELCVIMGREGKDIPESEALEYVAGYTVLNDISHRRFRPNPGRKPRERDKFFDWLHGKWFDSFAPCGPCIACPQTVPDPQSLRLQLRYNGELRQDCSTSHMIFPVAAVIAFISQMVTLEQGDMIATGTPAGVGSSTGTFLKPGDHLEASISDIGVLSSPVKQGT